MTVFKVRTFRFSNSNVQSDWHKTLNNRLKCNMVVILRRDFSWLRDNNFSIIDVEMDAKLDVDASLSAQKDWFDFEQVIRLQIAFIIRVLIEFYLGLRAKSMLLLICLQEQLHHMVVLLFDLSLRTLFGNILLTKES